MRPAPPAEVPPGGGSAGRPARARPRVQYLVTAPRAPAGREAVLQEIALLRERLATGPVLHLSPGGRAATRLPRRGWGLLRLLARRGSERALDLHHLFNPDPFDFAVLRLLRRPLVYSVVAGVGPGDRATALRAARRVALWTVPSAADRDRLAGWGVERVRVLPPGLPPDRLPALAACRETPPPDGPPTLLMGSAPWSHAQFAGKGIDALLAAAQRRADLRLVFLWRGVLAGEMTRRVRAAGLDQRVEVLDREVDVPRLLERIHAAVVLAAGPALVKAYPHSLLEALAAGRPALASRGLAIAELIAERGCGEVVDSVTPDALLAAVERLEQGYAARRAAALAVTPDELGPEPLLAAYAAAYREVLECDAGAPR